MSTEFNTDIVSVTHSVCVVCIFLGVQVMHFVHNILLFLNYLAFSAFTVLRIYALWDRSWITLLLVTPIALVKPALSLVSGSITCVLKFSASLTNSQV